jgi:hypothetical protein
MTTHSAERRANLHGRRLRTRIVTRLTHLWREELSPLAEELGRAMDEQLASADNAASSGKASDTVYDNIVHAQPRLREALEAIERCVKDPDGPGVVNAGVNYAPAPRRERSTSVAYG